MVNTAIIHVKTRLAWGFMVHIPFQTASPQPLPYPPPTTLVGALAAAYAKWKGYPETITYNGKTFSFAVKLLLDNIVYYASAGYIHGGVVLHRDLMRVLALPYLHQKTPEYWFSAQAFGKAYTPVVLDIVYLVKKDRAEELAKAAWGIDRIGSREGIASILSVEIIDPYENIVDKKIVDTPYYTPVELVKKTIRSAETYPMWKLDPQAYTQVTQKDYQRLTQYYLVPVSLGVYGGKMYIIPDIGKAVTVKIGSENVLLPRKYIKV